MNHSTTSFLEEFSAELAREACELTRLPAAEAEAAGDLTLPEYHERYVRPWRAARLAAGTNAPATLQAEASHLRAFAEWERSARPEGWPSGREWNGMPLRYINAGWMIRFVLGASQARGWAPATARHAWRTLRTILNHARKLGAIQTTPSLPLSKILPNVRRLKRGYTDPELGRLYAAVDAAVREAAGDGLIPLEPLETLGGRAARYALELKGAIAVGAAVGPRFGDLFRLRFDDFQVDASPPVVYFGAGKTSKMHLAPLPAVALQHVAALREGGGGLLFGLLGGKRRRAIRLLQRVLISAGIDGREHPQPWHSLRRSCTSRLNAHGIAIGAGSIGKLFTHGPDADVASTYYDNGMDRMARAIETIGWPAEFLAFERRRPEWFVPDDLATLPETAPPRPRDWRFGANWAEFRGRRLGFRDCRGLRILQILAQATRPLKRDELFGLLFWDGDAAATTLKTDVHHLRGLLRREFGLPAAFDPVPCREGRYQLLLPKGES